MIMKSVQKQKTRGVKSPVLGGVLVSAFTAIVSMLSRPVFAAENCGNVQTFFNWGCSGDGETAIYSVLGKILDWLAMGVAIAVVIGIIYGAIMYMTAGGNEGQAKNAIGIIRNALIALVLYFAMYSILNFIIPGGLFAQPQTRP